MVFQRANRGDDHHRIRPQARLAALDVDELLGAQVSPESGFGHHVVGELQAGLRGDDRIAAVRDIGKRPSVKDGRVVLQRLNQVRRQRVLQKHCHCAVGFQVTRRHRRLRAGVADDDVAQTLLQVLDRRRKAEDGHHFGGDHDVEAVLPRVAVGRAAERGGNVAQRAIVHVDHTLPGDAANVDVEFIAVVDVVVDHRGQQVVGKRDGREVTGEVQVDVFHRHHLRVAAAGRAALDTEHRAERRFAQADHRLLADTVKGIAQAHGRRRLAFTGRRRADGGNEDQLAVRPILDRLQVFERQLGLEVAVGHQVLVGDAELFSGDASDAVQGGLLGDVDVRCHGLSRGGE